MVLSIGQAINAHTSKFSVYKPIFETVFKIEFSPKDCTGIFDKPITRLLLTVVKAMLITFMVI